VTGFPTSSESSDSSGHRLGSWAAKGEKHVPLIPGTSLSTVKALYEL